MPSSDARESRSIVLLFAECRPPRSTASLPFTNTHTSSSPVNLNDSPPLYWNVAWSSVVKLKLCIFLSFPLPEFPNPALSSGKKWLLWKVKRFPLGANRK